MSKAVFLSTAAFLGIVSAYLFSWGFIWGIYVNNFWVSSMPPNIDRMNPIIKLAIMPDRYSGFLLDYHAYCSDFVSKRGELLLRLACQ